LTLLELHKSLATSVEPLLQQHEAFTLSGVSIESTTIKNNPSQPTYFEVVELGKSQSSRITVQAPAFVMQEARRNGVDFKQHEAVTIEVTTLRLSRHANKFFVLASSIHADGISKPQSELDKIELYIREQGYLNLKRIELPKVVSQLLAITSSAGGVAQDIANNIGDDINVTYAYCSSSSEISQTIRNAVGKYDVVLLFRGGHMDSSMLMFSQKDVVDACMQSKIAIVVGLGHAIDTPPIYKLPIYTHSTPSGAAMSLAHHNDKAKHNNVVITESSHEVNEANDMLGYLFFAIIATIIAYVMVR
jgi:exonuclease VII large subunit